MNGLFLSLSQFRVFNAIKAFQTNSKQAEFQPVTQQNSKLEQNVQLNSLNTDKYTQVQELTKYPTMLRNTIIFVSAFMVFNIILLIYYCYRVQRTLKERSDSGSIASITLLSSKDL